MLMRKGSRLIFFEFNRASRMYFTLLTVMFFTQILGFFVMSKGYMGQVEHYIRTYGLDIPAIQEAIGIFSPEQIIQSPWVMAPLSLCIVYMIAYTFFIWYRDWYGANVFIYRLFMLPVSRTYVFISKAVTILLMVIGIIAFQLFVLYIGKWIIAGNIPIDFRGSLSMLDIVMGFNYLTIFFPFTTVQFFTLFGGMFIFITIVFTAILLERSFHLKGIIYGLMYIIGSIVLLISPSITEIILQRSFVYPAEMFWIQVGLFLISAYISIRVSTYLLEKKVHV